MNSKTLLFFLLFSFSVCFCYGQSGGVHIVPGVGLEIDTVTKGQLVSSMDGWLSRRSARDRDNVFIGAEDFLATSMIMDELREMDRKPNDPNFYKCYLTNVIKQDSGLFLVQLSYIGVRDNVPVLRLSCTVLAKAGGGQFTFSSPLRQNTVLWKSRKIGNCLFHYKTELNVAKAGEYYKKVASYDHRLKAPASPIDFFCCDNVVEAGQLVGVGYNARSSGWSHLELGTGDSTGDLVVSGTVNKDHFNLWDPHDLWHGRLHRVLPVAKRYRPVDEGCAYLYGGSWQIYTWPRALQLFVDYANGHPGADWLALYKSGVDYVATAKNLKISYTINALIVERLEKEKGFGAVMELLSCGPKADGDANYFAALKRVVGVGEEGFNEYVNGLLMVE